MCRLHSKALCLLVSQSVLWRLLGLPSLWFPRKHSQHPDKSAEIPYLKHVCTIMEISRTHVFIFSMPQTRAATLDVTSHFCCIK